MLSTPQRFQAYLTPFENKRIPLTDATSYVITETHAKCDMSTYTVSNESFFNVDDKMFFTYDNEKVVPTTIDEGTPPALIVKKYCQQTEETK